MRIRQLVSALLLAPVLIGAAAADDGEKLNYILFNIDDLGWTDLACFGSRYFETPNIDGLAASGMKFTDAYAACAVCSPTRAALMTGRYPARVGITDWIRARFQGGRAEGENPVEYVGGKNGRLACPPNPFWMEHSELTLAEVLKGAGYATCHIGKWHLGPDDWYPERQGFDFNFGGCDYGQPPSYFDPYKRKNQAGIHGLPAREEGEYLTDREADEAVGFIRRHREEPFFLYMANYAVHTPIQAKAELTAKYKAKPKTNQKNAAYAAMVESVDDGVGEILAAIDELGLTERTVVIFTSDNGGLLGPTDNAPLRSGKGFPYEGGIRVPLIVRWPGVTKAGAVSAVPVSSVDYFPTIAASAGVELPDGLVIDGLDLMPVLRGGEALDREAIFWHFPHYRGKVIPYSIVRQGDWKLLKRYEGPTYELFNLKDDLSEKQDLAEQLPERVEALDSVLVEWLEHTGAKLPRAG
ncbi:MAG: sulfatase [Verrucomicrobiales bacterium]